MDLDILQDHEDDQNSISSSSSSSTSTMDYRLTWLKKMTQHFIHHPVIGMLRYSSAYVLADSFLSIVCSSETNSTFMLDCFHAGAADYLVKPLYLPVIQTLFLVRKKKKKDDRNHVAPPLLPFCCLLLLVHGTLIHLLESLVFIVCFLFSVTNIEIASPTRTRIIHISIHNDIIIIDQFNYYFFINHSNSSSIRHVYRR